MTTFPGCRPCHGHFMIVTMLAVFLTLTFTSPAASQDPRNTLQAKTPAVTFLTPLATRFVMSPDDPRQPRLCRETSSQTRCPSFLTYGRAAGDNLPTIDPALKANLPHVRVTFVVQRISNEIVANGGLDLGVAPWPWVWWTSSNAASVETGDSGFILPTPGQTWTDKNIYLIRLYDALVFNACDTFSGFPVEHRTSIQEDDVEIGAFHGVDASTLDATGFYNFQFKVRAENAEGRASDFHFSGKVSVTCSGLNSLP